ncbi:hypothetical protein C3486_09965 [Streptomyces sp. Ru73]|uniref:hypothetical protein n=1 Tax=Streptomyces sp. Ru73 TaxID=2080748 RepID=UPI000CDD78E8|nr:hypothetical protein [Streptomyces sp. Ru73]POX41318.1 hypothetical protein C3486_09965 [Streptomyces sp. Ru73]
MDKPKIMTVTVEFEVGRGGRNTQKRIKSAHEAAVRAALEAVKTKFEKVSVTVVGSRMTWDYRAPHLSAPYAVVDPDAAEVPPAE